MIGVATEAKNTSIFSNSNQQSGILFLAAIKVILALLLLIDYGNIAPTTLMKC